MLSEAMPVRSWQLPWVFAVSVDASSWVASLSQLVREARARRVSLSAHVGTTTDTTAVAVFREDGAAMLGGLIALTGLALHQITGSAMPTQGEPGDPRRQRSVPFLALARQRETLGGTMRRVGRHSTVGRARRRGGATERERFRQL